MKFGITDAEKWKRRIHEEHLDTKALRKTLAKEKTKDRGGRPRKFVSIEKDGEILRGYAFQIRRNASANALDGVSSEPAHLVVARASRCCSVFVNHAPFSPIRDYVLASDKCPPGCERAPRDVGREGEHNLRLARSLRATS